MNMGYCRFRNTEEAIEDCKDHITDELGSEEHAARKRMLETCKEILEQEQDIPTKPKE